MIQYDTIWYNMIQYDIVWYNMIQYDIVWYSMIQYDTLATYFCVCINVDPIIQCIEYNVILNNLFDEIYAELSSVRCCR